jgi:hypothetical protein
MNISMQSLCNQFHERFLKWAPSKDRSKSLPSIIFPMLAEMAFDYNLCCWTSKQYIPFILLNKIRLLDDSYPFEFMVDMCWTEVDWRNQYEKRIELAIECEFVESLNMLEWDFAKLLHINTKRKLFIYDSRINKKIKEEHLKKMVECYDLKRLFSGDQILLIDISKEGVKCICWEITKSRKVKERFRCTKQW